MQDSEPGSSTTSEPQSFDGTTGWLNDPSSQDTAQPPPQTVSWTASEFIAHHKTSLWYIGLAAAAIVLAALLWLLTRDVVSPVVVMFGALMLGFYGSRQPQALSYQLDQSGLVIGQKRYSYDNFKSFSVAQLGAFSAIVLMPLHRFAAPLEIYYAPEDEDAIFDLMSLHLPIVEHHHDMVERLMHYIRF